MKIKIPSLSTQIVLALLLGAVFGTLFKVDSNLIILDYGKAPNKESISLREWKSLVVIADDPAASDTLRFTANEQLSILAKVKRLTEAKKTFTVIAYDTYVGDSESKLPDIVYHGGTSIRKESTIATSIKWIGDLFIRLLNMIAIPLVLGSLIVGAASLGDIKKFARIGVKTMSYYLITTVIAVAIGLVLANIIRPGERMESDTRERLLSVYQSDTQDKISTDTGFDLGKEMIEMIPKNPIKALAEGNMLQIVVISIFLGMVLTMISRQKADPVIAFFDGLSESMIKLVEIIMKIAPFGVFALIAATVGEFGFEILETLMWYSFTVILGQIIHLVGTYSIFLKLFSKMRLSSFFKGIRKAQTIAFSTSSSAATLPVSMECAQNNLGVSKSISSFTLPLGATVNMDGTALYQGVATVFIAQVFGIDLSFTQQIVIILMATLASIGTAPVPGVGVIMLIMILKAVGIPEIGIALILGVDRILDMIRTITNITGDLAGSVIVASSEGEITHPDIYRK